MAPLGVTGTRKYAALCPAPTPITPLLHPPSSRGAEALGLPPPAAFDVEIMPDDAVTEVGKIASLVEGMLVVQVSRGGDSAVLLECMHTMGGRAARRAAHGRGGGAGWRGCPP